MPKINVAMTVNGKAVSAEVEPRTLLIHFLRENLQLTGSAYRLRHDPLRRCTVDIDGMSVKSCTMFAVQARARTCSRSRACGAGRQVACAAGRLPRDAWPAVRLLHARHDHPRLPLLKENASPTGERNPLRDGGKPLPLHRLPEHRQGRAIRGEQAHRQRIQGIRG